MINRIRALWAAANPVAKWTTIVVLGFVAGFVLTLAGSQGWLPLWATGRPVHTALSAGVISLCLGAVWVTFGSRR
jgi:hypothetical protein